MKESSIDYPIFQFQNLPESKKIELPSEYAERMRTIPAGLTPFPGRFSFGRFPYFRRILDSLSPLAPTKEVVLMKGNQVGANAAALESFVLYNIGCEPKAQLSITTDEELAKKSAQIKIERMIDSAGLRHLIFSQTQKK
jgi:phage terminase large subunit GpA-like protein